MQEVASPSQERRTPQPREAGPSRRAAGESSRELMGFCRAGCGLRGGSGFLGAPGTRGSPHARTHADTPFPQTFSELMTEPASQTGSGPGHRPSVASCGWPWPWPPGGGEAGAEQLLAHARDGRGRVAGRSDCGESKGRRGQKCAGPVRLSRDSGRCQVGFSIQRLCHAVTVLLSVTKGESPEN